MAVIIRYAYIKADGKYLVGTALTKQCSDIILGLNINVSAPGTYKIEVKLKDLTTNQEVSFYSDPKRLDAGTFDLETKSFKLRYANVLSAVWNVVYDESGNTLASGVPVASVSNLLIRPTGTVPTDCPKTGISSILSWVAGAGILLFFLTRKG